MWPWEDISQIKGLCSLSKGDKAGGCLAREVGPGLNGWNTVTACQGPSGPGWEAWAGAGQAGAALADVCVCTLG